MAHNIAVIGVGGWGKNHARVLSELDSLTAVCDADANRSKEIATKYKANSYSSVDDLLEKESNLDGCLVCTPTKTHYSVACRLIEKGINIFVEKPLSFASRECQQMTELAEKNKVILTCGYIERFNPAVQKTKQIIDENKCGDLLMMEFHRESRMPVHIKDVGIIYDTSVHDIDTAMYLFGSTPRTVSAHAGHRFHSLEDFATIMLGFENQKVAIIASNWITPKRVRTFSAVCTDGILQGDFLTQEVKIDNSEGTTVPRQQIQEPLLLELRSFLDAIDGKHNNIMISGKEATNVTRVAEAAIQSSQTNKTIELDI